MVIIMLGAPGSGKGTVGQILSKEFQIPHVSSGDIFRNYGSKNEEFAKYMREGKLIPDELVIQIMKERLEEPDVANGIILDGFPRTMEQGDKLQSIFESQGRSVDVALHLDLPDQDIINRIVKRRTCPNCQAIYNLEFKPPKQEGVCDVCGTELVSRTDDNEETVKQRLKTYHETSELLVDYYRQKGKLYTITLNKDSDVFAMDIPGKMRDYLKM